MKFNVSIFGGAMALALLVGCGRSSHGDPVTMTPTPTPTQPTADSFTQSTQAIVATSSETAEPVDITGFAVVPNESGSPIAIY